MSDSFGRWLVSKRGVRGEPGFVSQRELADRMGVDPTYVSQLEKRTTPPSYDTRQRVHAALGTTEDELITLGIVSTRAARPGPTHAVTGPSSDPIAAHWSRLSPEAKAIVLDLIDGLIRLDEIPGTRATDRDGGKRAVS